MVTRIGEQLIDLCSGAEKELWIVAPFIKTNALNRLLRVVPGDVVVNCVTRWRPIEIASGISDITVWDLVCGRSKTFLWLRNDLHAKYYRADHTTLVGSANVTMAALGWAPNNNLELLIRANSAEDNLREFENLLLAESIRASDEIYTQVKSIAADLTTAMLVPNVSGTKVSEGVDNNMRASTPSQWRQWLPSLRNPHHLYLVYQGASEQLGSATLESGRADLDALDVPAGLPETLFNRYVGVSLLQHPIIDSLDAYLAQPRRFGEVTRFLRERAPQALGEGEQAARGWQTLMRWLMYFLPNRYTHRVPHYTEVFQRI